VSFCNSSDKASLREAHPSVCRSIGIGHIPRTSLSFCNSSDKAGLKKAHPSVCRSIGNGLVLKVGPPDSSVSIAPRRVGPQKAFTP